MGIWCIRVFKNSCKKTKFFIVTATPHQEILLILKKLQIKELFEEVIGLQSLNKLQ